MEVDYIRMGAIEVVPLGWVRNEVKDPVDDIWGGLTSRIELDASRFTSDALIGLDSYSHVEVLFHLDRISPETVAWGSRYPRNRRDWPLTGIFAQRAKNRPNRLAVTICRLIGVKGLTVEVEGLDAINGTPVLDIKPYLREFAAKGEVKQPAWATELMAAYWGS